ncbi:MAG: NEW3 domain-containing protein [Candidatus Micrarchaeota archaeon]|nr:NEW3 domain-containing protein [Candidatus Micrarchaeota archaeon]
MKSTSCLVFFVLLASFQFAAAGSNATQGGNISLQNLTLANGTATWYGIFGNASSSAFSNVTVNATPGAADGPFTFSTGSANCANGYHILNFFFSNHSGNFTTLMPGSLATLDDFIASPAQNGTATFTSSKTFETAGFGNITSVPSTYTEPASLQNFPLGYLQDQDGNLVFIAPVAKQSLGFNGTTNDFQAILPTKNSQNTTYYMSVDMGCNSSAPPPPPPPPPTPSGGGSYTVSPGVTLPFYREVPRVQLPTVPPSVFNLRVLRFTSYREASAGDQVVVNPLIENPSGDFVTVNIGLSGAGSSLSSSAKNVLLAPHDKQTVPFSMNLPSDMPGGYYSFSVVVSFNNSNVSYPSIIRVVPTYRIGQPTVRRQFLLDYSTNETTVILTVTNTAAGTLPHLQVFESLPSQLAERSSEIKFSAEAGGNIGGDIAGVVQGPNIRWDLENIHSDESRSIFYRIPYLVTDTSEYPTWNVAQLVEINPASGTEILLRDLQTPSIAPGEKGEISMTLFNTGVVQRDVDVEVLPPAGWKITPRAVALTLASRESQKMAFFVESPQSTEAGTYGFTVSVKYADTAYDKLAFIYVNKPIVQFYAPPLSDQFTAFLGGNIIPVVFVVVAGALLVAGLYFSYRFINAPRYNESRLEDMQNMEQMFNQKIFKDPGAPFRGKLGRKGRKGLN